MAISNLIGVGNAERTFTCSFDQAQGGYAGSISKLLDQQYLSIEFQTADKVWAAIKGVVDPSQRYIVYVAIAGLSTGINKGNHVYVGKTKTNLKTRYSDAGPNSGGLQQVFQFFTANPESLNITIYGTTHPCFIEGWCFQAALNNSYTLYNILDPN